MFSSRVRNKPFKGGDGDFSSGFMDESAELIRTDCDEARVVPTDFKFIYIIKINMRLYICSRNKNCRSIVIYSISLENILVPPGITCILYRSEANE